MFLNEVGHSLSLGVSKIKAGLAMKKTLVFTKETNCNIVLDKKTK